MMSNIYCAPKPQYSRWQWFKFIAIRIIFPPILLWDLIKFNVNWLLGKWVGTKILPGQEMACFSHFQVTDSTMSRYQTKTLSYEIYDVVTHDLAHLHTLEIQHIPQRPYQPYIINFVGNATRYEDIIKDMQQDAEELQATVVGFNFRGVYQSTRKPKSSDDLVTDGIAQVQRLLDQGISPQQITLKGHSLGAAVASLVALHFHQREQPINLFNSRSFSTITNFLVGHIRLKRNHESQALGHQESIRGIILGWLVKPFIMLGLTLVKWEINAGDAFKRIPAENREYIVIRSQKEYRVDRLDDCVIPHYASIHQALTSERQAQKMAMTQVIKHLNTIIPTADPRSKPILTDARDTIIDAKTVIKYRKMEAQEADAHNAPWESLSNRVNTNAQQFFHAFITHRHRSNMEMKIDTWSDCTLKTS